MELFDLSGELTAAVIISDQNTIIIDFFCSVLCNAPYPSQQ